MNEKTVSVLTPADAAVLRRRILRWFGREGRVLPWRSDNSPWRVLVSEFMLQQTQVDRVIPRFVMFMERWPSPTAMAAASQADVVRAWSGLGYNRRAKHLWETARMICESYGGVVPDSVEALSGCPGIGRYTAAAIVAFAFDRDVHLWDTNIRRIFLRVVYGGEFSRVPISDAELGRIVVQMHAEGRSRDWYGALMDFGSAVCTGTDPSCKGCPLRRSCIAAPSFLRGESPTQRLVRPQKRFVGSHRQLRGNVIKLLAASDLPMSTGSLAKRIGEPCMAVVRELELEGLVSVGSDGVFLK